MPSTKVWFVTGASSGLGKAMVQHALRQGDKVVATLRKPAALSELSSTYLPTKLLIIKLDVTSISDITSAFGAAIEHFGRIDIVYNNAGYVVIGEAESTPDDVARAQLEVNFWGATNVAREAVRVFRDLNSPPGGRLLQASSVGGVKSWETIPFYCASKFALEGFSEALSKEVHPSWNIKVTILELGSFATNWAAPTALVIVPPHPAYLSPDSATMLYRQRHMGPRELGDASKAAREMFKIARDDDLPLRVPLGLDAIDTVRGKLEELEKVVESSAKWSTDLK